MIRLWRNAWEEFIPFLSYDAMRWKPVLNALAVTFGDRWPAAETY
ncbi:hypothetical protein [Amycolatopsis rhizosphaerae]|nr:hypothetical protein [Amycolatopsis rhizosphaerae]